MEGLQIQTHWQRVELLRIELIVEKLPRRNVVSDLLIITYALQFVVDVEPFVNARSVFIDSHLSAH